MNTQSKSLDPIINFLQSRHPAMGAIAPDVDLVDTRIIDSLDFVEMVFLIESATGQEINLEEISVDKLRSLQAIEENFFQN